MILTFLLVCSLQRVGGAWDRYESYDWLTYPNALDTLGDWNDDGRDDLLIGRSDWPVAGTGTVLVLSGSDGTELLRIEQALPGFGRSVAALGDLDMDGVPDFAVGAPLANSNGLTQNGSVLWFSGKTGSILHLRTGYLRQGQFGAHLSSIRVAGNEDLLVSAPEIAPNSSGGFGVAYLFEGRTASLRLSVNGPDAPNSGGWNTADAGSYGGASAFAIGTPSASLAGTPNAGRVTIYSATNGAIVEILAPPASRFGTALARLPDMDGDQRDDLAVVEDQSTQIFVHLYGSASGRVRTIVGTPYSGFGRAILGADFDQDGEPELAISNPTFSPAGKPGAGAVFLYSLPDGNLIGRLDGSLANARMGNVLRAGRVNSLGGPGVDLICGSADLLVPRLAETFAFNECLFAESSNISAAVGGRLRFRLNFPASEAGAAYLVLASGSGIGSTNFAGVQVPLARDVLYDRMLVAPPLFFHGVRGRFDADGAANAALVPVPGSARLWVGRTLHLAAVSRHGWLGGIASTAVPIVILP